METFKIECFEREYGPGTFPWHKALDSRSAEEVRQQLARALGMDVASSGLEMLLVIQERSQFVEGVNAEDEDFDLRAVLEPFGLAHEGQFYLNWYRFDKVDVIGAADVIAHFSDIWYPSSDDIEIFDRSMSWVVSIAHYGVVSVMMMGNDQTSARGEA